MERTVRRPLWPLDLALHRIAGAWMHTSARRRIWKVGGPRTRIGSVGAEMWSGRDIGVVAGIAVDRLIRIDVMTCSCARKSRRSDVSDSVAISNLIGVVACVQAVPAAIPHTLCARHGAVHATPHADRTRRARGCT